MTQPQSLQTPRSDAYTDAVADVRARLVAFAATAWAASAAIDQASLALLVGRVVPAVAAAQLRVANLTASFLARQTGGPPALVIPQFVTSGRGIAPTRVYARPMIAARTAVKEKKTFAEAREIGAERLESLVTTDVQMAKVRQADMSLWVAGRQYYRRVPKGRSTCALCLIASTQRYRVGNLLPIHPGCDCGVEVLPAGADLDEMFDASRVLEATHAKVEEFAGAQDRGGRAPDYRKLLITHDHGEIGALVGWRGQGFTGPNQVGHRSSMSESKADIARRHLPILQDSLVNLRSQGQDENSPQITYHLNQIARFTADLASA